MLRKATAQLISEGLLFHRHGARTFIRPAPPQVDQLPSRLTSLIENLGLRGFEAGSPELEAQRVPAQPEDAMMLGIEPDELVLCWYRLWLAIGTALAIEHVIVPLHYLPG